jgi:enoyl-[acyl-carrier-protein] reductase (NADH)
MSQSSGLMKGKRGVILGVANNRSIAWGIALACHNDMSRDVTGEVHHVDSGYHVVGMKHPDAPDISRTTD